MAPPWLDGKPAFTMMWAGLNFGGGAYMTLTAPLSERLKLLK
jgi:hypothetical protein